MKLHFSQADIKVVTQKCVYQGHFKLRRLVLQHRLFSGGWSQIVSREVFERDEAVGVLLLDPDRDHIVLIEQFRAGIVLKTENPWLLEIVAGVMDTHEEPEATAQRESLEETGLVISNLSPMCRYWVSPGASSERTSLYCGQVDSSLAKGIHGLAQENEDIRLLVLPLREAYHLLDTGKIDNALTIIALYWLQRHEKELRKDWSTRLSQQ